MSLQSQGVLTSVEEPAGQVEVLTAKARFKPLCPISGGWANRGGRRRRRLPKALYSHGGGDREVPSRLNVIGLTVEDALPQVDRFIDQALLHGLEKVEIIHGVGSELRSAIGKYLQEHRAVMKFAAGDVLKGGGGVTIVELE